MVENRLMTELGHSVVWILFVLTCTARGEDDVISCPTTDRVLHFALGGSDVHRVTVTHREDNVHKGRGAHEDLLLDTGAQLTNSDRNKANRASKKTGQQMGSETLQSTHSTQAFCRLTLAGCSQCRLRLTITGQEMPTGQSRCSGGVKAGHVNADSNTRSRNPVDRCRPKDDGCASLWVYESSYPTIRLLSNGSLDNGVTMVTLSSRVTMDICYETEFTLKLNVAVEKNIVRFEGSSAEGAVSSGSFTSPHFPLGYGRQGEQYSYLVTNRDAGGTVRVTFEDWDLGQNTRLMFYEPSDNGSHHHLLSVYYGYYFRPVVRTSGASLLVVFEPDVSSALSPNLGFRALYEFLPAAGATDPDDDAVETDCGGHIRYVTGGHILYSASHWTSGVIHDCIWVLHKSSSFSFLQTIVWNFTSISTDLTLEIREGVTSLAPAVVRLTPRTDTKSYRDRRSIGASRRPTVVRTEAGFYVRLRGLVYEHDNLTIAFASYNQPINETWEPECGKSGEFYCPETIAGHREDSALDDLPGTCIDRALWCDGLAHCPGREDEPTDACDDDYENRANASGLTRPCPSGEFPCVSGDRCVSRDMLCDGEPNCPDGSDELYCDVAANVSATCGETSRLCGTVCVLEANVCHHEACANLWLRYGCSITGAPVDPSPVQWSLVLPLCFSAFCLLIVVGIVLMRIQRHPKLYVDAHAPCRRSRRFPLTWSRGTRCHPPCTGTSSCSGFVSRSASPNGLISRSASPYGYVSRSTSPCGYISRSITPNSMYPSRSTSPNYMNPSRSTSPNAQYAGPSRSTSPNYMNPSRSTSPNSAMYTGPSRSTSPNTYPSRCVSPNCPQSRCTSPYDSVSRCASPDEGSCFDPTLLHSVFSHGLRSQNLDLRDNQTSPSPLLSLHPSDVRDHVTNENTEEMQTSVT